MIYRKNVATKEAIARLVGGALMLCCGYLGLGLTPLGFLVMGVGAVSLVTGLVGYCPACALAGRKLLND